LGCDSVSTPVTATSLSADVASGATELPLGDLSGFSVGDILVMISAAFSQDFEITELIPSSRRLLSKRLQSSARRLTGGTAKVAPAAKKAITIPAVAAVKAALAVTTTTHDKSVWWPSWAWWLLFIGLGLCLAAIAAIAAMMCMKKKAPKKKAAKPMAAPPPTTTTMPVTTTAVPMTYAQPAPMMYAQQYQQAPSYSYTQPLTTAQPMTTTMAAPSFTTAPGYGGYYTQAY
jgi:hypothetical protein